MNFQTVDYIDWFRINWHDIDYDLATSGLHPVSLSDVNIHLDDLNLGKTLFFGHPKLVEMISEIYGVEENEILITSGSTHANYLMCALLIEQGDEVIIERPVYTPLLDVVKFFGAKVKYLERKYEEGYNLNLEQLKEMTGKDTRMMVFTNLHNPSGAMTNEKTLKAISEIADDNNIYVLSDEVYRDFIFENAPPIFSSLTQLGISTCSVSKFYGAGALRVGWAMCREELVDKARKLNDYILAANSCGGEEIAALIMENRSWFVEKIMNITKRNRPLVKSWIEKREDLEGIVPRHGFICFPRLLLDIDSMELTELLLKKYRTMISPARFFDCEKHIRIGYGGDEMILEKGLEYLGFALDELGGSEK
ncbi:MAG: aminotransferase class I/II-fold pyridoxal phosphate-dependent enzyme [Thermoplasmata archaeon]|nr:MAG: aminotransferase class I/II-fold pyridoxal phosphate-dependent enzyme [Thermoplasmata archaeon]